MSRSVTWLLGGFLILCSAAHFLYSGVWQATHSMGGDALSALPSSLMYRLTLVWPALAKEWIVPKVGWNYGPLVQIATAPLVLAGSLRQAWQMLLGATYVMLAVTVWLWIRLAWRVAPRPWVVIGIMVLWLNFFPLLNAVIGREYELWELFLLTTGLLALRRHREGIAGTLIGLAGMVKVLPLLFIPLLFLKGYRRAGIAAIVTVMVCVGAAALLLGWQHSVTLQVLFDEGVGNRSFPAVPANQAVTNVLYKMFLPINIHAVNPMPPFGELLRAIAGVIDAALLAASLWFLFRWRHSHLLELEAAMLMVVMILVPPHANTYYMLFTLPAVSLGLAYLARDGHRMGALLKAALAGSVLLTGFLVPMQCWGWLLGVPSVDVALTLQAYSWPAFGAMLSALVAVGAHQLARSAAPLALATEMPEAGALMETRT